MDQKIPQKQPADKKRNREIPLSTCSFRATIIVYSRSLVPDVWGGKRPIPSVMDSALVCQIGLLLVTCIWHDFLCHILSRKNGAQDEEVVGVASATYREGAKVNNVSKCILTAVVLVSVMAVSVQADFVGMPPTGLIEEPTVVIADDQVGSTSR